MISNIILSLDDRWSYLSYAYNRGVFFTFPRQYLLPKAKVYTLVAGTHTCRETFAHSWRGDCLVGFALKGLNIKKLNKFFNLIESKLGLKERSTFYETVVDNALYDIQVKIVIVDLSPFWIENSTNRSLFTLLLRCGAAYYKENSFLKALEEYHLTSNIIPVIKWFLKGNTKPTYAILKYGFVTKFRNVEKEKYQKMLVKP